MQLLAVKNIAIFLAIATTAFGVATIVLAVQKADLENELQDALNKLDLISTVAPPLTTPSVKTTPTTTRATDTTPVGETTKSTTTTTTTTTTTAPSGVTTPSHGTTNDPWPTLTVPQEGPTFPTLPPGLTDPESIVYRLPSDMYPVKYNIYWHPNLETKTCEGSVSIQIEIVKETNLIIMHAKHLEVGSVSILNMMARNRIRVKRSYQRDELLIIELEELLRKSTAYTVSMSFECSLEGLSGIYASSYQNENGQER